MNLFQLVIKQMRQRALSTWLTLLSVTLGVGLAITILILYREAGSLFGQTDYGCDVLLGKPGSGTQLVMNTIYHIDKSPGNIKYSVYQEMLDPSRLPRAAVPVVIGDFFQGKYRFIGTTTNMFGIDDDTQKPMDPADTLPFSPAVRIPTTEQPAQHYAFAEGKCFVPNRFEAVIGSEVAAKTGLKIGSEIPSLYSHQDPAAELQAPTITGKWTVVGILKQSFTATDDSICIPIRSYYAIPEHAAKLRADWAAQFDDAESAATKPASPLPSFKTNPDGTFTLQIPEDQWEISAILATARPRQHMLKSDVMNALIDDNSRSDLQVVDAAKVMKQANPNMPTDFGFDVIFGPPGAADALVKNAAYHIGQPIGSIPWSFYDNMNQGAKALPPDSDMQGLAGLEAEAKHPSTEPAAAPAATEPATSQPAGEGPKDPSMNFYGYAKVAIPVVVGDTYKGKYRIIGTTTNLFGINDFTGRPLDDAHKMGYRPDMFYEFADGHCFAPMKFEAIIGSDVALKSDLKLGSQFQATHGETPPTAAPDIHPEKWVVVGVLKPTHTANDNCIFIPIMTDYTIEDHELGEKVQWALQHGGAAPPPNTDPDEIHAYRTKKDGTFVLFVPPSVWEISAIMVKARGDPQQLIYATSNRNEAMAINPAGVMRQFFDTFLMGPTLLLLVVAFLVSIVAAVGILVSIYNSVSARMREIAIMRALGATRTRVLELICIEAGLVGFIGSILGLIGGHALAGFASGLFDKFLGQGIKWYRFDVYEVYYLLSVVVVALLAGLVPAMKAYTTPVATNLVVV